MKIDTNCLQVRVFSVCEQIPGFNLSDGAETICGRLNELLGQMTDHPDQLSAATLEGFFRSGGQLVLALDSRNDRIMGMASLVLTHKVNRTDGCVEDVVVDQEWRQKGVGEMIMRKIMDLAQTHQVRNLALTSKPARIEALALYGKFGFKKVDTNLLRVAIRT